MPPPLEPADDHAARLAARRTAALAVVAACSRRPQVWSGPNGTTVTVPDGAIGVDARGCLVVQDVTAVDARGHRLVLDTPIVVANLPLDAGGRHDPEASLGGLLLNLAGA